MNVIINMFRSILNIHVGYYSQRITLRYHKLLICLSLLSSSFDYLLCVCVCAQSLIHHDAMTIVSTWQLMPPYHVFSSRPSFDVQNTLPPSASFLAL